MTCLFGMTLDELAERFEGLYKEVYYYDDAIYAYPRGLQLCLVPEGGNGTGWGDKQVFEVVLNQTSPYSLNGYRIGVSYEEQIQRALSEGWIPVKDDSYTDTMRTWYEKTVDNAVCTLFLFADAFENPELLTEMVRLKVVLTDEAQ